MIRPIGAVYARLFNSDGYAECPLLNAVVGCAPLKHGITGTKCLESPDILSRAGLMSSLLHHSSVIY
ncbi:MAG: hypothetical protein R6T78_03015 [Dehalococcoidales bacterium]